MLKHPTEPPALFTATITSARQFYNLLKCLSFSPHAQLEINPTGIKATADLSRVMQAHVLTNTDLFANFTYTAPADTTIILSLSLPTLLECLLFFTPREEAPSPTLPRLPSLCTLFFETTGAPLTLTLNDYACATTCSLTTYDPEIIPEIPLALDHLVLRVIMRSCYLHDAITELEVAAEPAELVLVAEYQAGLQLRGEGGPGGGSCVVEFKNNGQLLSNYTVVGERVEFRYKFSMIKNAMHAMRLGSKVSVRLCPAGVMSMQFMIEMDGGDASFVDFRFLPLVEGGVEGQEE